MKIAQFLEAAKTIQHVHANVPVEATASAHIQSVFSPSATITLEKSSASTTRIRLGVLSQEEATANSVPAQEKEEWMFVRTSEETGIELYASHTWFLYRLACRLVEDWIDEDIASFKDGQLMQAAFKHLRPAYDSLLNNHARTAKGFDPEDHIREMARLGYTHVEVNGLASTFPYEHAEPGELLYRFYTYCAGLDQFVYSRLNKGIYPFEYLRANLNKLKDSARLAEKYGLRAGILAFEPRSVPDELLERYPMLRGARVDHPLRSFRPRYNLTTAHPVVLDHYAEMLEKILREAPNIDYMVVWSNDSGAGFEYTSSLYVGRNGGGYVIREFKGDEAIKNAAANNIIRYMKTLRDAGRRVNPEFRSVLRSEMFSNEQDKIWEQVEEGIEIESNSLIAKGFDLGYQHPKYDWADDFNFCGLFNQFSEKEKPVKEMLEAKGSNAHLFISPGTCWNQEPVIAPIYPRLLFEKLKALKEQEVSHVAALTGSIASSLAPHNINQEILQAFQNDPEIEYKKILQDRAENWVGKEMSETLINVWEYADEAYRSYPPPVSVLSMWGTWYRVLVRPFIPNFEALSEEDRAYYEDFHLGHANNRVRVDFRREVNFDFCDPPMARRCREAISDNVLPVIEKAVREAKAICYNLELEPTARSVWLEHFDRLYGTKCWYRTQRNVASWIEGVHGYIESNDSQERERCREITRKTVLDEKENAKDLLQHVRTASTEWMLTSAVGETTFIYGDNFAELLEKKIALMEGREDDEPYIDPDFMWRVPGVNC